MKEYKWARRFKEKYVVFLVCRKNVKTRIKKQSEGYILFGEKKYREGITVLKGILSSGPRDFFRKSVLILKMNYEIYKEELSLEAQDEIDLFRGLTNRYFGKKKIEVTTYEKHMNFLHLIELLVDTPPSATRKTFLLEKLESLKTNIAEYSWLKEKINEL